MTLSARIVAKHLQSRKTNLDGAWVTTTKKEFLALTRNIPRIKNYADALKVSQSFNVWRTRFNKFFFEEFLNTSIKYRGSLSDGDRKYIHKTLSKIGWDFYIELNLPLSRADDYYGPEARFNQYQKEVPTWLKRVQRKARTLWKELENTIKYIRDQEALVVNTPDVDKVVLEGFQFEVRGFEGRPEHYEMLETLRASFRHYRNRAKSTLPWLLQHQLPMILEFALKLDKAGSYNHDGTITIYASAAIGEGPQKLAAVVAHEMGHHMFKGLSGPAKEFWSTAINRDYGPLDVANLLEQWPESLKWGSDFVKSMASKDSVLALQVDVLGWQNDLNKREDFQAQLEKGVSTIPVPKTPITGYAGKNPEEGFCEAIGLLVAYGPRAVHDRIRRWLEIIIPGRVKLASQNPIALRVTERYLQ